MNRELIDRVRALQPPVNDEEAANNLRVVVQVLEETQGENQRLRDRENLLAVGLSTLYGAGTAVCRSVIFGVGVAVRTAAMNGLPLTDPKVVTTGVLSTVSFLPLQATMSAVIEIPLILLGRKYLWPSRSEVLQRQVESGLQETIILAREVEEQLRGGGK